MKALPRPAEIEHRALPAATARGLQEAAAPDALAGPAALASSRKPGRLRRHVCRVPQVAAVAVEATYAAG